MPSARGWQVGVAAVLVAAAVATVALRDPGAPTPVAAPAVALPDPSSPEPAPAALRAGETLHVAAAALGSGEPFLLEIAVPPPRPEVDTLAVSIFADDRRSVALEGRIAAGDRARATVAIDGAWLATPGRYVVEVRTGEASHFPIRRYAIEVR